ncbi:hypothetical protein J437_LFUL018883, partial [Ladona fulva]
MKLRDRVLYVSPANTKHQPDKPEKLKVPAKHKFQNYVNRCSELEEYERDCGYLLGERQCMINDLNDDCLSLIFSHFNAQEKITVLELVKKKNAESLIPIRKLYVTNVHGSTRNSELRDLFSKFGNVVEANIRCGRQTTRRNQYYAFVTFEKPESAEK